MTAPSREPRVLRRAAARVLVVAALGLASVVVGGQASAAGSAGPGDGASASPSVSASVDPSGSPGGSPSADPSASPSASASPVGGSRVDGTIAVGGLRASYRAEPDPFAGTLHLAVTVQNLSDEVIEPQVAFSLTSWLGVHLDAEPSRPLGRLAPGERRTAEVDLAGVGQWGLVDARVVLTPPPAIGGIEVGEVHRDRWLLAPPWLVVGGLVLVAGGVLVWRVATRGPAREAASTDAADAAPQPAPTPVPAPAGAAA